MTNDALPSRRAPTVAPRLRWFVSALCAVLFLIAAAAPSIARSPGSGTVTGRVLDAGSGEAMVGARVSADGTASTATTDATGAFRLAGVPEGSREIRVEYLGSGTVTETVEIAAGQVVRRQIELSPVTVEGEAVDVVSSPLLEGQARALNQQKHAVNIQNVVAADQIGRFPDGNAAEAAQRIPGISIQRDQGEGRYVLVRGTEARLNSMMINGERLPSPEGDVRNVALDVIPTDLIEAIEVSKTLTPDMDGDAIGGAVNLVTRQAPTDLTVAASLAGGTNDISDGDIASGSVTVGRRFVDDRVGLLLSGSLLETDRGSENFEVAYDDGSLEELEFRNYSVTRERTGVTVDADLRASDAASFELSGIWNQFDDTEIRRRLVNVIPDGKLEREIKDRFESQVIEGISARGEQLFDAGRTQLTYGASWSAAEEDEPDALYSVFLQEDVEFDPNVSPDAVDPDDIRANPGNQDFGEFALDELVNENNRTTEEDLVARVDASRLFYRDPSFSGFVQAGLKLRQKDKDQALEVFEYSPEEDFFLTDFLDGFSNPSFLDGRYDIGRFFGPSSIRELFRTGDFEVEKDFEEDAGDYEAEEDVYAAYGMTQLELGADTTVVAGLRYEQTETDSLGYEVVFDEEGDYLETLAVRGSDSYATLLPMAHLVHRLDERSNVRAAITRTLARPNYIDLAPYELIFDEDEEIERGNPDLDVTTAWNVDVLWERYLSSVGVVQAGLFYKTLSDYIYVFRFDEIRSGTEFEIHQPRNGESADLWGVELAYQNRFRDLPAPFDGLGLYANYTYTDSSAEYPDRDGEDATLPGQAESVGNLALSYEKGGFSGRFSLNFHGKYIDEVGGSPEEDVYYDDHLQLDFSASQRLTDRLRLYVEVLNLTDEPLRYYEGSPNRPIQEEYYSWWGTIGLRWDL